MDSIYSVLPTTAARELGSSPHLWMGHLPQEPGTVVLARRCFSSARDDDHRLRDGALRKTQCGLLAAITREHADRADVAAPDDRAATKDRSPRRRP